MNEASFRKFLETDYQGKLGQRSIGDLISRCKRIEKSLDIDLDQGFDCDMMTGLLQTISSNTLVVLNLRNALARYQDFKQDNP